MHRFQQYFSYIAIVCFIRGVTYLKIIICTLEPV